MAKQLVTIDNLDDFICRNDGKFYMDGSRILSPGARDELARRGVSVQNGCGCNHPGTSCAEAAGGCACKKTDGCCSTPHQDTPAPEDEEILIAVAATLQKDYGVSDPDKLRSMTLNVIKVLKESLSVY